MAFSTLHLLFQMMKEDTDDLEGCLKTASPAGCLGGPAPPLFDLPPPPVPPWLEDQNGCNPQRPLEPDPNADSSDFESPRRKISDFHQLYTQSCDINTFVIDSRFYFGENLFTILLIVLCSCILVGIMLAVAIVIYR